MTCYFMEHSMSLEKVLIQFRKLKTMHLDLTSFLNMQYTYRNQLQRLLRFFFLVIISKHVVRKHCFTVRLLPTQPNKI